MSKLEKVPCKKTSRRQLQQQGAPHQSQTMARTTICREVQVLTDVDILTVGLSYVGFDKNWQLKVNLARNMKRFKQFFGTQSIVLPNIVTTTSLGREKKMTHMLPP